MAYKYNPTTGKYEDDGVSPYDKFRKSNSPVIDSGVSALASGLMGNYGNTGATYRNVQSYIPQDTLSQLGKASGSLANYKPEKINVGQVQTLPTEYYQKQVEDLSAPLAQQYDKARATMRGDQSARGTLSDSQGYNEIIDNIDRPYIEQLGNITRGVELEQMKERQANEQAFIDRSLTEATGRRDLGLQGLTSGANQLQNTANMYGTLGLQDKGLDSNMINSLLGYGADRYKSEADLFGNMYTADSEWNRSMIEDQRTREQNQRQALIDLLNMQGYTEQPQGPLWEALAGQLGATVNFNPTNTAASGAGILQQQNDDLKRKLYSGEWRFDVKGNLVDKIGRPV